MSPEPRDEIGSADSVVLNLQAQVCGVGFTTHAHLAGLRVLGRIGQRFCDNVIGGDFGGLGQPPVDRDVQINRDR